MFDGDMKYTYFVQFNPLTALLLIILNTACNIGLLISDSINRGHRISHLFKRAF